MLWARSTIFTGSPISSTKTSPRAGAEVAGPDHQLDRLRDGHEVAGHLRVGDGDRPAALDLAAEDRHDAARRAEHVAEADADEAGPGVRCAGRLDDPLGHRLRGAHHGPRVDRLVGRDQDEALAPAAAAVSAVTRVAIALLRTASSGFASISGTCL